MLSNTDIRKINQVRTILDRLESECSDRRTLKPEGWLEADAYDYGRVAQCANSAGDLLFDLLNAMNAYRVQEIEEDDMHNRIEGAS